MATPALPWTTRAQNYIDNRKWRSGALWAAPSAARGDWAEAGRIMGRGAKTAWKWGPGMKLNEWGLFSLVSAGMAAFSPRGHRAANFAASMVTWPLVASAAALIGGAPAALLAGFLVVPGVEKKMAGTFQWLHDFAREATRLHMGGQYYDTQAAYTMRQVAVREMAGSLMNARQFLGKEGILYHQ